MGLCVLTLRLWFCGVGGFVDAFVVSLVGWFLGGFSWFGGLWWLGFAWCLSIVVGLIFILVFCAMLWVWLVLVLVDARFVGVVGYSEMFGYAAGLCRLVALVARGGGLDCIVWCF